MARRCSRCFLHNHSIAHCPSMRVDILTINNIKNICSTREDVFILLSSQFTKESLYRYIKVVMGVNFKGTIHSAINKIIDYIFSQQSPQQSQQSQQQVITIDDTIDEDVEVVASIPVARQVYEFNCNIPVATAVFV